MKKKKPATPSPQEPTSNPTKSVTIVSRPGDDPGVDAAKAMLGPYIINGFAVSQFVRGSTGEVALDHIVTALADAARQVNANDMAQVEATLMSQAITLNAMFGELARRSAVNMANGNYFEATQRYFAMAMKAQNQCRMTLETLSNIKNPPVVYARQANIANGPQQVNNGTVVPAHAVETQNPPIKLLDPAHEQPLDNRTPGRDQHIAPTRNLYRAVIPWCVRWTKLC